MFHYHFLLNVGFTRGESTFFKDYGVSMMNMDRVGVLKEEEGQIRKICSRLNKIIIISVNTQLVIGVPLEYYVT